MVKIRIKKGYFGSAKWKHSHLRDITMKRRLGYRRLLYKALQVMHFVIAFGFSCFGVVEFVNNPPYFDGYGDAKDSQKQLPKGLFQNDPRMTNKSHLLRYMDLPILVMLLAYFAVCCWLKFHGLSWLLTGSIILNLLFFFLVNYWAREAFSWKHYSSRINGLELQVLVITLSVTLIFMVIFYTRRKMPFKLKSSLVIQPFGKIHLAWNFVVIFLVTFTCLLLWFSKLYISWACFNSQQEVMTLCEKTNMVQCYFCEECDFHSFRRCAESENNQSFHCQSPTNFIKQQSFCIFNYNVSTYTFLTVFGYVGGLCVFLGTFSQILIHYLIRFVLAIYAFCKSIQRRRRGTSFCVVIDDGAVNINELDGISTELQHPVISNVTPPGSLDTREEMDGDENDLGNILINASIG